MRIHSVVIITSGSSRLSAPARLDHWIHALRAENKKVVLVLGPDGDDFLLGCKYIEMTELVFDPNFQGGIFSGVKAGLHAVHSPTLVLSLTESHLDPVECLHTFETEIAGDGTALQSHAVMLTRDDHFSERPFLVTQKGVRHLRELPSALPWPEENQVQIETLIPRSTTPTRLA